MYLGIEIGGTKLQLGIGAGAGVLAGLWRGNVNVAEGPEGIRHQITTAVPELLTRTGIDRSMLRGVGIGFGGPVDDVTQTIIKSHQIAGWDDFPLADWIGDVVGLPAALGNDADVAGLAEALYGAGKGMSPIFYITVGSGIGGGLIVNGEIYRGVGRGAAEIGHLRVTSEAGIRGILEDVAAGWGMESMVGLRSRYPDRFGPGAEEFYRFAGTRPITAQLIGEAAAQGDLFACAILVDALTTLAEAICHVITLLCPRRIVIGGGVSLMGQELFFTPLRRFVAERVFKPFAGLTDIVPAALGEEVVVHGALALARKRFDR
jgi:glucokinase